MSVTEFDTRTSTPPPPVRVPPKRRGSHIRRPPSVLTGLSHLALVVWAFTVVAPILWTFLASFKTNTEIFSDPLALPHSFSFDPWGRAWAKAHVAQYLCNSVVVVAFATAGTMLFGSMAAYVL